MCASTSCARAPASARGTSRKSIDAVASVGIVFEARRADVAAANAAQVERGQHDALDERRVVRFRRAELQSRRASPSRPTACSAIALRSAGGDRRDVVVEVLDQNAPVVVAHAGDEVREQRDRVRRPVAVVAAVQPVRRAVDRHARRRSRRARRTRSAAAATGGPARRRTARRRRRAGPRCVASSSRRCGEPGFLLALEEELEVHRRRDVRGAAARRAPASIATIGALSSLAERA